MYESSLQERGRTGILHFVSNDDKHDRSIHRAAILGLRLYLTIPQPFTRLQPYNAHGCRRARGRFGRSIDDAIGRDQDSAANKRHGERQ